MHHHVYCILTIYNNPQPSLVITKCLHLVTCIIKMIKKLMRQFEKMLKSPVNVVTETLTWKGGTQLPRTSVLEKDVFEPGFTTFILFLFISSIRLSRFPSPTIYNIISTFNLQKTHNWMNKKSTVSSKYIPFLDKGPCHTAPASIERRKPNI